jgi:hypothetical protein
MKQRFPLPLLLGCLAAGAAPPASAGEHRPAQPWPTVARTVRALLDEDPQLARRHVEVSSSGLVLTVSGSVADESERRRAMTIARAHANPHMIVSDALSVASTPPPPPAQSRAAQYRLVRGATPPPPPSRPPPARR